MLPASLSAHRDVAHALAATTPLPSCCQPSALTRVAATYRRHYTACRTSPLHRARTHRATAPPALGAERGEHAAACIPSISANCTPRYTACRTSQLPEHAAAVSAVSIHCATALRRLRCTPRQPSVALHCMSYIHARHACTHQSTARRRRSRCHTVCVV